MNTESNGIERAMETVNLRVNDFEQSLDNIIGKIENVSATFHRLIGMGTRQTQRLADVKNKTLEAVSPIVSGGQRITNRVSTQVRENPRTVLVGAALVIGGLWLITRVRANVSDRDERFMH